MWQFGHRPERSIGKFHEQRGMVGERRTGAKEVGVEERETGRDGVGRQKPTFSQGGEVRREREISNNKTNASITTQNKRLA